MFRTVPLSIIRSFSLYTQQCYVSFRFADSLRTGSGRFRPVLILLASCQQTCMIYTIAVCTVKNSWWWTEELSETCRVLSPKLISEISASSWSYYENLWRCMVTWTSNWTKVAWCVGGHYNVRLHIVSFPLHIPEIRGVAIKKPDSCSNPLLKKNQTIEMLSPSM